MRCYTLIDILILNFLIKNGCNHSIELNAKLERFLVLHILFLFLIVDDDVFLLFNLIG